MAKRTCDRIGCQKDWSHVLYFADVPLFHFCENHFGFAKKFLIFDMDALSSPDDERQTAEKLEASIRC